MINTRVIAIKELATKTIPFVTGLHILNIYTENLPLRILYRTPKLASFLSSSFILQDTSEAISLLKSKMYT